ncbi:MAG: hypothetical protein IPO92_07030 [Saprospiraceae bacterium]|nr:hypothetical protein [Saprospiraceae bacterium]
MQMYYLALMLFFQLLSSCNQVSENSLPSTESLAYSLIQGNRQEPKKEGSETTNIIFQSSDDGQTWQDISKGLPNNLKNNDFFALDNQLYFKTENEMYLGSTTSTLPGWKKRCPQTTVSQMLHLSKMD